nr:MAG TPA: hypothetical protein [Caudoviricetes sp.]
MNNVIVQVCCKSNNTSLGYGMLGMGIPYPRCL